MFERIQISNLKLQFLKFVGDFKDLGIKIYIRNSHAKIKHNLKDTSSSEKVDYEKQKTTPLTVGLHKGC